MPKLDLELVRHALNVAKKNGYREVELGIGPDHFHAKMEPVAPTSVASEPKTTPEAPTLHTVQSNAVGYYAEGAMRLIPGQRISKGDQVAAIEALGLANDLEAKFGGLVVEVLVKPGDPVEYGQVLATVQPE
jgi:acetyl-CoA carboxylase biotin carboxyl carrier protein